MTKRAFDKIAAGLNEAIDIASGDAKPACLHVLAELKVKATRAKRGLSPTRPHSALKRKKGRAIPKDSAA